MELKMHAFTHATYPQPDLNRTYGANLSRAARLFIMALFGIEPAGKRSAAQQRDNKKNAKTVNLAKLYRLASSYDSISPNLANEIRASAKYQ
jgi:hypothetical protein